MNNIKFRHVTTGKQRIERCNQHRDIKTGDTRNSMAAVERRMRAVGYVRSGNRWRWKMFSAPSSTPRAKPPTLWQNFQALYKRLRQKNREVQAVAEGSAESYFDRALRLSR